MKYFLRVLAVLIFAVAIVYGVYCYTDSQNSDVSGNAHLTTVTKAPVTEKGSDRVLLNSLDSGDEHFELYQCGTDTILIHNGKEYLYHDWSKYIMLEKPEMHYRDYDSNPDDNELVIRIVSSINDETGDYIYDFYLLNIFTDDKGEEQIDLVVASERAWRTILGDAIKMEVSQPSYCPKFVQISMTYKWEKGITYNEDGIADTLYTAYAHAVKDGKGGYLETERWSFGQGAYDFTSDDEMKVNIDVVIHYKNSSVIQKIGKIRFELALNDQNDFACQAKTMSFTPYDEYKSLSPQYTSDKNWSYTEYNSDKSVSATGDKIIDWLKYSFEYDKTINEKTVSYSSEATEMRNIEKLVFTNNDIKLYAKEGYTFSKIPAETGAFKVVINEGYPKSCYEIAYKAKINEENGKQVLTITLEHSYPQKYFVNLTIYYNAES